VYICICRLVSRSQIESLVASGLRTVEQISAASTAGTECGKCRRNIQRVIDAYLQRVDPSREELHAR
jgi:bacterioferritin-associated ferredoxin